MPAKALQATRMLLASQKLHGQKSAADFEKPVDPMHEGTSLQVTLSTDLSLVSVNESNHL